MKREQSDELSSSNELKLNSWRSFVKDSSGRFIPAFSLFFLLGIMFIPYPYHLFSFQKKISQFLFGDFCHFVAVNIFGISNAQKEISSDSATLYILLGLLFLLTVILSFFWKKILQKPSRGKLISGINSFLIYYLALHLFKYGFHKIFKGQFYLPEPNILYTPLGELDQDILFWSTMGTSYSYNVFMGMLEVIPAVLILFKKTRKIGLFIAVGVLTNIVAINFCFDISVKILSSFLLLLALYLLAINYFNSNKEDLIKIRLLKILIPLLLLIEAAFPYISKMNFNDDLQKRPPLHGAYQVDYAVSDWADSSTYPLDSIDFHRIFIHRHGYMIFQNKEGVMQDFKLETNLAKQIFTLRDYQENTQEIPFVYNERDSSLILKIGIKGEPVHIHAKTLNWEELPALQPNFHWTIEGVE